MAIETTPIKYRGVINILFIGLPYCFGELMAAVVGYFTLGDEQNGN